MSTSIDFNGEARPYEDGDGGRMSLLEHLDELRARLVRSAAFVCAALAACWFVSDRIYDFLAVPIKTALADVRHEQMPVLDLEVAVLPLASLPEGAVNRYVFAEPVRLGGLIVPPGASALARVSRVSRVVIMVAAAVLSPTSDVLNMLLFAAPMFVLYTVSIFVAWLCGRPRAGAREG
jgi:Sec-independent protein secretion pathway component TatC